MEAALFDVEDVEEELLPVLSLDVDVELSVLVPFELAGASVLVAEDSDGVDRESVR